jgi:hypothetical protein
MYSDHDNKNELWKDMFSRMVKGSDPLYATSIYRLLITHKNTIKCDNYVDAACLVKFCSLMARRDGSSEGNENNQTWGLYQKTYYGCNLWFP